MTLTHFSLCSGIGGIDLAGEMAGFQTVGQCEIADFPTKVLEKHWPDVPRWRDIRDVTAESIRKAGIERIDLLSGGIPCQPHSLAGKRQGTDDERELWSEYRRIVSEVRPKWCLVENVPGFLSTDAGKYFRRVLRDFAELGYRVGWCVYGACEVGADHERERVFVIGYSNGKPESQTNSEAVTSRSKRDPWKGNTRIDWKLASRPDWPIHPSGILGTNDGLPNRMDRSIALGNAVVPMQVYPILKAIADIENNC